MTSQPGTLERYVANGARARLVAHEPDLRAYGFGRGPNQIRRENHPHTSGVTTSVVVVLAASALLRGDSDTAGALLDYAGFAIIQSGIRTPVDMILYAHYLRRLGEVGGTRSQRDSEQAEAMSPSESIALGLTATSA